MSKRWFKISFPAEIKEILLSLILSSKAWPLFSPEKIQERLNLSAGNGNQPFGTQGKGMVKMLL